MRLTLRTLLAYMEDALPPEDARLIGRKVAASESAKRMIRRIRKVMRRRRLTAPPTDANGSSSDPNRIAEYLDNVMDERAVTRLERRCIRHDLNLAEVAGCHQILSRVLGDPVAAPTDARLRLYAKLGIAATVPTDTPAVGMHEPEVPPAAAPKRGWWNPEWNHSAIVAVLAVALGLVLWRALGNARPESLVVLNDAPPRNLPAPAPNDASALPAPKNATAPDKSKAVEPTPVVSEAPKAAPKPDETKRPTPPVDPPTRTPPPPPKKKPAKPMPAVAPLEFTYSSPVGILLRLQESGPERLQSGAKLLANDVVVNLDFSRSTLETPTRESIEFVDTAKAAVQAGAEPALRIVLGKFVVRTTAPNSKVRLAVEGTRLVLEAEAPGTVATLEMLPAVTLGDIAQPPTLIVTALHPLKLTMLERTVELPAEHRIEALHARGLGTAHPAAPPTWAFGSSAAPAERKAADELYTTRPIPFGKDTVLLTVRDRAADRNREIRKLAVRAAAGMEAFSILVDAIGDPKYPDNRQTAIAALRGVLRCDPPGAEAFRLALHRTYPEKEANLILTLTLGYSPERRNDRTLLKQLVEHLDAEPLAIRELAITNLKEIVGKDFSYSAGDPPSRRATAMRSWKQFVGER